LDIPEKREESKTAIKSVQLNRPEPTRDEINQLNEILNKRKEREAEQKQKEIATVYDYLVLYTNEENGEEEEPENNCGWDYGKISNSFQVEKNPVLIFNEVRKSMNFSEWGAENVEIFYTQYDFLRLMLPEYTVKVLMTVATVMDVMIEAPKFLDDN
jgi:hypothetical protein